MDPNAAASGNGIFGLDCAPEGARVVLVPVPFDATTSYRPGTSRGPLPERVYVSLDIDGLDPALCPHTGTPVPGGLSFRQAGFLLSALARSGREIIGFDVVEVAPGPDGDAWDGNVGARLVYKLIGWALHSAPVAQR